MPRKKSNVYVEALKQSKYLEKLKNRVVRIHRSRVSVYEFKLENGKWKRRYVGWIKRSDFEKLKGDAVGIDFSTRYRRKRLPKGFVKPKFIGSKLELFVKVKTKKGWQMRKLRIFAYTRTQKKVALNLLHKHDIKTREIHKFQKLSRLYPAIKNLLKIGPKLTKRSYPRGMVL